MTDNKIGEYAFMVEPFHVDFNGRLTLGVLGNHLLNCASIHAKDRGFGIAELNEQHYTWVLSRLVVEMNEFPREYADFKIRTWVENVYRLFTNRNFEIIGAGGLPIGYARSIWAMISMETRKPIDLLTMHEGRINDYICQHPCPIAEPGRVKLRDPSLHHTHQVVYSDLDINGHTNSIRYIEHMLDLFDISRFREKRIARFEIAYMAESHYGDMLDLLVEEASADVSDIEIRRNGGEPICRGRICFA